MRLVHQQVGAILMLERTDLGQRCNIAEYAVQALDHDQRSPGLFAEAAQTGFEARGVVVAKTKNLRAAHAATVIQAGMCIGVEQHRVAGPEPCTDRKSTRLNSSH